MGLNKMDAENSMTYENASDRALRESASALQNEAGTCEKLDTKIAHGNPGLFAPSPVVRGVRV